MKIKRSIGEHIFDTVNIILLILVAFVTLYPFWYVLICSLSNPDLVIAGKVNWYPIGFELASYKKAFEMPYIWTSYANTIFYSVVGTGISIFLTILSGYALAKKRLHGRIFFTWVMLITMWFSAGLIPSYLNIKNLGLLNNRWTVVIAHAISAFYVVLMRTYFESISDSLEESAKMDGANDWLVLFKIYVPLSVPCIMTIAMYYFVGRWNEYFFAMLIMQDEAKLPLQVILQKLIMQTRNIDPNQDMSDSTLNQQTIIYATIMVAALPMICIYPFVQKFFVKGIMIGAVKG